MLGWWGVRRVLQRGQIWQIVALSIGLGLFWGTWTTILIGAEVDQTVAGNIVQPGDVFEPIPIPQFAAFAMISTTMWVFGNILVDRVGTRNYRPGRTQQAVIGVVTVAMTGLMIATVQIMAGILLVALGVFWVGLARNARVTTGPNLFAKFTRIGWLHHLLLFLTPVVATLSYDVMVSHGWALEPALYAIPITLAGAVMLVLSFVRLFMMPSVDPTTPAP